MKCILLDAGSPVDLQPITCTRPLADCTVANIAFRTAQIERLRAAGLQAGTTTTPADGEVCLYVAGNAWPSVPTLQAIPTDRPVALRDADGELLAWVSDSSSGPGDGSVELTDNTGLVVKYPWDLLKVNGELVGSLSEDLFEDTASDGVYIDGHVRVGPGTRLLPGVYIEGNVLIGCECKIGPNCYLRGNTSIGDRCHIGNAVEIKNSIIMSGTSVGHLSYCGDSVLCQGVNFGAGTITANLRHDGRNMRSLVRGKPVQTGLRKFGTIVGDNAHLGIHTSIYPGRKIWPGSTTLPGSVVAADITGS